jgi:hypothetical protein
MKPSTGIVLRLVGPLIEIVCIMLIFALPAREIRIGGVRLLDILYGGIGFGLLLVIAGLTLVQRQPRSRRRPPEP